MFEQSFKYDFVIGQQFAGQLGLQLVPRLSGNTLPDSKTKAIYLQVNYKSDRWPNSGELYITRSNAALRNVQHLLPDWKSFVADGWAEWFETYVAFGAAANPFTNDPTPQRMCQRQNSTLQIHFGDAPKQSQGCLLVGCPLEHWKAFLTMLRVYMDKGYVLRESMHAQMSTFLDAKIVGNAHLVPDRSRANYIKDRTAAWSMQCAAFDLINSVLFADLDQLALKKSSKKEVSNV